MPSPLSVGLRECVVGFLGGGNLLPSRHSPLRGQHVQRQPLVGALPPRGPARLQAYGRQSLLPTQ